MTGHTPWKDLNHKRSRAEKIPHPSGDDDGDGQAWYPNRCDCGHEGMEYMWHTNDCPGRPPKPDRSDWEPVGQFADNGIRILPPDYGGPIGDHDIELIEDFDPPDDPIRPGRAYSEPSVEDYDTPAAPPHTRWILPGDRNQPPADDEQESVEPADDKVWTTAELRSARSKAQGRAKTQLAHEFRMRYRILYQEELAREGLTVRRHRRVGHPASKTIARERAQEPDDPHKFPLPAEEHDEPEDGSL